MEVLKFWKKKSAMTNQSFQIHADPSSRVLLFHLYPYNILGKDTSVIHSCSLLLTFNSSYQINPDPSCNPPPPLVSIQHIGKDTKAIHSCWFLFTFNFLMFSYSLVIFQKPFSLGWGILTANKTHLTCQIL